MKENTLPKREGKGRRGIVSHLSSVHPPFDTRIFLKECRFLAESGYEVNLIVPHDRSGRVEGVNIIAVPKPKNRWTRVTKTSWQVFRAALKTKASVYHFHDPELIPMGILLKFFGKRVAYDVHEDVPLDILTKTYLPRFSRKPLAELARLWEQVGSRLFDGVVAATPTIASHFPEKKTIALQNFPIPGELVHEKCVSYPERDSSLIFVGAISELRGAKEMVRAMALLPPSLQARLNFVGEFDEGLESELKKEPGWAHVASLGWKPRPDLAKLLSESRIGLVLFHPGPNHDDSQPNKLFEYMSAGLPIICSNFPRWRELIERLGCGLAVDPIKPQAIADAIQWLLEHPAEAETMGERGRKAIQHTYNWPAEARKLLSFYEQVERGRV